MHVIIVDPTTGNPLNTLDGALDVHDADVHTSAVNTYVHQHSATTTTFAVASAANVTQIIVASAAGFTVGDRLHINTTSIEQTHPIITNIAGQIIYLDRPLDKAHSFGDAVTIAITDMSSQVGTLLAPQIYSAKPPAGEVWHITSLTLSMIHSTAGDFGLFGNLAALSNGVVLRVKSNGVYRTLTNWKTNGDINTDTGDVQFSVRSTGGGSYGTGANGAFKERTGSVIKLNGDTDDEFLIYVQDDITTLALFEMKVQGHLEGL